jgi:hypothetical protein
MKYGIIAEGSVINAAIYKCFDHIREDDQRTFVRKFREQPHDGPQVMHTFRELVLGAFLAKEGLSVFYDPVIGGLTPDWAIGQRSTSGVIELVNFHLDRNTDEEIRRAMDTARVWTGWMGSNVERLYPRIWDKAGAYKQLVEDHALPYVVAVFGTFTANVQLEEVKECVSGPEHGLFAMYPSMSGVLFFEESGGCYFFTYIPNPLGTRPCELPSGTLDLSARRN